MKVGEFLDSAGIPYYNYGIYEGYNIGVQRNPLFICSAASRYYLQMKEGDSSSKSAYESCIGWLRENLEEDAAGLHFNYYFDLPPYGLVSPWTSALANARGITTMFEAFEYYGDSLYIHICEGLINTIGTSIYEGGNSVKLDSGLWFEEYVKPGSEIFVLNGHLTVIGCLWKYHGNTGHEKAYYLSREGLKGVVYKLPEFITEDNWSYYNLIGRRASLGYHKFHISQVRSLYINTGSNIEILRKTYELWEAQLDK